MEVTTDDSTDKDNDMKDTFEAYVDKQEDKKEAPKKLLESLEAIINPDKQKEGKRPSLLEMLRGSSSDKSESKAGQPKEHIAEFVESETASSTDTKPAEISAKVEGTSVPLVEVPEIKTVETENEKTKVVQETHEEVDVVESIATTETESPLEPEQLIVGNLVEVDSDPLVKEAFDQIVENAQQELETISESEKLPTDNNAQVHSAQYEKADISEEKTTPEIANLSETVESMSLSKMLSLAETIAIREVSLRTLFEQGQLTQEQLREVIDRYQGGLQIESILSEMEIGQERLNELAVERLKEDKIDYGVAAKETESRVLLDLGSRSIASTEVDNPTLSASSDLPDDRSTWAKPKKNKKILFIVSAAVVTAIIVILAAA